MPALQSHAIESQPLTRLQAAFKHCTHQYSANKTPQSAWLAACDSVSDQGNDASDSSDTPRDNRQAGDTYNCD